MRNGHCTRLPGHPPETRASALRGALQQTPHSRRPASRTTLNPVMKFKELVKEAAILAAPYRVTNGAKFRLKDYDPDDTNGLKDKKEGKKTLEHGVQLLSDFQEKLYAQDRWSLLLIFQGMDAAGKDGAIKHVMSGINPEGCDVTSFKTPSHEELAHDYLWRAHKAVPQRGKIGIFNRSYYEEVLVIRVHQIGR